MKSPYRVELEVRPRNAHGVWDTRTYTVTAVDTIQASIAAVAKAHDDGWETRFPVTVTREEA